MLKDEENHYLSCQSEKLRTEKKRVLGNLKGRLSTIDLNPYLTYWAIESLGGRTPEYREEKELQRRRIVNRAYNGQNMIGWGNLSNARATKGMRELQEWWVQEESRRERRGPVDHKSVVARALSLIMQCRYQFWKIRCEEVMKMEKPARVARVIEAARELEGDMELVEPRDRHPFDPGNLPGEDDPVQKIED